MRTLFHKTVASIGSMLYTLGQPRLRAVSDPRLVFYHGIGNNSHICLRGLKDELPLNHFSAQLDYLMTHYEVIALGDFLVGPEKPSPTGKPYAIITFDDGLKSIFTLAYPELKKRHLPFTVFVNTHCINNHHLLWLHLLGFLTQMLGEMTVRKELDRLANFHCTTNKASLETILRQHIRAVHKHKLLEKVAHAHGIEPTDVAPVMALYLTTDELAAMSQHGCEVYSHTHHHLPLKAFSDSEVEQEINDSVEWLQQYEWGQTACVSFPFGMISDYGHKAVGIALANAHQYVAEVGDGKNSLKRITEHKLLSRAELGHCTDNPAQIYTTIELMPTIKHLLRKLRS